MRFSILIFCCFQGTCWTSHYCVYQPKSLSVIEGNSVSIPCSYIYPEYIKDSQIRVTWGERDGLYCSINKPITDHSGNIIDEYKDRISIVKPPGNNRTEHLIIREVKASDGITFCCSGSQDSFPFYDKFGTSLYFAGEKQVSQMEELIAVPGEELIIPCYYPVEKLGMAQEVTWYTGESDLCSFNKNRIDTWGKTSSNKRYSLVNFPEDVSLRIRTVQDSEYHHFCCQVTVNNEVIKSRYGTELIIAGSRSSAPFTVMQPHNITGREGDSITLTCSHSQYQENDVLWVNIYWRAGNKSGPYVYHPYKEMVHSSYKDRVEMKGAADLHIRGLQTSDDSMYYCFVMLKLCTGNSEYQKIIQHGEGTRLIVKETENGLGDYQLVIIISISMAVLLILCVILIILKTKGVICKKKNVQPKTMDNAEEEELPLEERPYCEISTMNTKYNQAEEVKESAKEKKMEREVDEQETENILYTELNKAKLQPRNLASYQNQEEHIVYAAVISPNSRG
ncbi:paired immunoglobulin-like type 2 receptor alpha [Ranitomeya variabilis]|uniref:paired immunoglobulin-like type 2 receptor alpha n=1 Tax=Ranitomeya variabilis TaxID=490064 RepID=UPI004055B8E3